MMSKEIRKTTQSSVCIECGTELGDNEGTKIRTVDRPVYSECEREVISNMAHMGRPDWEVVTHHGPHIRIELKECDSCYKGRSG